MTCHFCNMIILITSSFYSQNIIHIFLNRITCNTTEIEVI